MADVEIASEDERAAELLADAVMLLHAGERSKALQRVHTAQTLIGEYYTDHLMDALRHQVQSQQARQMAQNIDNSVFYGTSAHTSSALGALGGVFGK